MIDLEKLTDEEVWVLTCSVEEFHDSIRKDSDYTKAIVEKACNMRELLRKEYRNRNISYRRWQNDSERDNSEADHRGDQTAC